MANEDKANGR
jgi:chromosome segregation ATPase